MKRACRGLPLAVVVVMSALLVAGPSSAAVAGSLHIDPAPRSSGAIAVVGDSLTYSYWSALPGSFRERQWGPFALEARSARRTLVTTSIATSGVDGIRRIRSTGFDPFTWIIALGTNDMNITYKQPGATDALIDALMTELGSGHHVIWVNVYARDFPAQTRAFNDALTRARGRHSNLVVADWYSEVMAHQHWIGADGIHPTIVGAEARNRWLATLGFARVCPPTPVVAVPTSVVSSIGAGGATAAAQAVRLCPISG